MNICGPARIRCAFQAENDLFLTGAADICNCLPACATVTYDVESYQVDYELIRAIDSSKYGRSYDSEK